MNLTVVGVSGVKRDESGDDSEYGGVARICRDMFDYVVVIGSTPSELRYGSWPYLLGSEPA